MNSERNFAMWMVLPAAVVVGLVVVWPFIYNVILSFSNMSLLHIHDWEFIGPRQYEKVFSDTTFYTVFGKTLLWTIFNVFFHVTIGVSLAVILHENVPGRRMFRTLLILPWAIPAVVTALTWRGMFHYEYGAVNLILTKVLNQTPIQWLNDPIGTFAACVITNVWLGFPFMMVVALGGLQSIPKELYEAAMIDGASAWQRFKTITLPMLVPVLTPAVILGFVWTFNKVDIVWLVSNGGEPADQTHILVSYVYRAAFNLYRYGYAAAGSMIIFLLLVLFSVTFMRRMREKAA
ncbi:MAG: sugar ABC transporter permease [bacterium]|nr:sugar ABC transporter permease [bacterium]MBK8127903.1 sugar ABC transporter permease [bacterium]